LLENKGLHEAFLIALGEVAVFARRGDLPDPYGKRAGEGKVVEEGIPVTVFHCALCGIGDQERVWGFVEQAQVGGKQGMRDL
jgi:hypothetical protein